MQWALASGEDSAMEITIGILELMENRSLRILGESMDGENGG